MKMKDPRNMFSGLSFFNSEPIRKKARIASNTS